ncbi:Chitooligosaccharide deacetylase [subsurface metagenome]
MDKRIIINADDFGLCDGVNKAVAKAHTEGILTSTTIMVNMPAADEAVKIAKKLPTLGVGVHLNLFEGRPVSKDSRIGRLLDADGRFARSLLRLWDTKSEMPSGRNCRPRFNGSSTAA